MQRITILGGAGYIGSVLVGKLLSKGHQIIAIDNLMYGQQSLLQYIPNPNFQFIWGDVEDLIYDSSFRDIIKKSEYVFPLSAIVGAPSTNRETRKSIDVNWTFINLLTDLCRSQQSKCRIVFPTTNSGYGTKTGEVFCTEETELEPISPYGKQKVGAEKYLLMNYENTISLRLATVFGVSPRMRLDLLVNFFVWKAVTEGILTVAQPESKRNYVHIDDVCDCFIHCMDNFDSMKGNCYNVGLNENHSKGELSEIVQRFTGCEILETKSYQDPDKRNYIVSNEKINRTGFHAMTTVEKAMPELIMGCKMLKMLNYGRSVNCNA